MEEIFEDTSLNTLLTGMSDSSKFNQLSKTIYALRSKYLARGLKHDQVTQKIMSKIFNTKSPVAVNWFNMKSTIEYHQIKNLCEMDPKTIELALAIKQEIEKMKKKKKHGKQGKDYSLDEMLDLFQYRLESSFNLDINSSSSSSDSPSEIGDNYRSPEHSNLSYYDQTIQNFNFDSLNFDGFNYAKEQTNIGKRKCKKGTELEDDIWVEAKGESKKKLKVPYKPTDNINMEGHRAPLSTFLKSEKIFEPSKRNRENDNGINAEKHKSLKM